MRRAVEDEAMLQFAFIARRIEALDPPSPLWSMARDASDDERRHSALCAKLAEHFGVMVGVATPALRKLAPSSLAGRDALTYDVVAQCCIAETESMATLVTLLESVDAPSVVSDVLRALARDEVKHAQLGWAYLAREVERAGPPTFLAHHIPSMLTGSASALFDPSAVAALPPKAHADDLVAHGVLPHRVKQRLFLSTMHDVVLPGFERHGVPVEPTQAWLARAEALMVAGPGGRW